MNERQTPPPTDCLEFRRQAGADPSRLAPELLEHRRSCAACDAHLRQLQAMDALILDALRVPAPTAVPGVSSVPVVRHLQWPARSRWLALAASVLGGAVIGSVLWFAAPRDALAADLVAHLAHEPEAMVAGAPPADPAEVAAVLARSGIRLRDGAGRVSYASSCLIRGRIVPHLVVQSDSGPVTVMVLRNEPVRRAVAFEESGYQGTILPAGPGSVAVIGRRVAELGDIGQRISEAVEWVGQ